MAQTARKEKRGSCGWCLHSFWPVLTELPMKTYAQHKNNSADKVKYQLVAGLP